ncbi:heavy metal-responsive transcriptional regulator [bacterium]|nr:heavy metal-responsive transcriptional regulator [bacterium]
MSRQKRRFLKIGEVAKEAGVNVQTVRYYERREILIPAERMESGYRLYTPDAVRKLRFVKNAQRLGFTLSEMSALLKLRVSNSKCGAVLKKAEEKLRQVEDKIAVLNALRRTLERLVSDCRCRRKTDPCPVLRTLDTQGKGV